MIEDILRSNIGANMVVFVPESDEQGLNEG